MAMHISVIEDNPGVRAMVESALELHGHRVEAFGNSPSFLTALRSTERMPAYDLVIVDLFLESECGTDLVDELRATQPQVIPTILMSAAEESSFAPIRKKYPNLQILRKPFKMQALFSLIKQVTFSSQP